MTEVLGVDLSIRADRHRGISRADGQLEKPLLLQRSALVDRKDIAILAIGIYNAVGIYAESIHTPFETVGMIVHACDRAVRLPSATQRVGVLKLPFGREARTEL